jgi:transcription-repair coupling factor (superfamily II helicase)
MQEVGFAMYSDMLTRAVRSLKAGKEPDLTAPLAATTEINLHAPALLPADYCGDVHERLTLYKRLADCASLEALEALHEELVDRFGKPPPAAKALLEIHRLRILSAPLGISRIDSTDTATVLQFVSDPPIDAERIIRFIQSRRDARLAGPDRLRLNAAAPTLEQRVALVKNTLRALQPA